MSNNEFWTAWAWLAMYETDGSEWTQGPTIAYKENKRSNWQSHE